MGNIRKLYERHMGNLFIYKYVNHVAVKKRLISNFKYPVILLEFSIAEEMNGDVEPVGMFYYAGSRKYIWRDEYYSELLVDIKVAKLRSDDANAEEHNDILKMYAKYKHGHIPQSEIKPRFGMNFKDHSYCRALYRIIIR